MSRTFSLNANGIITQALQLCGALALGSTPPPDMMADGRKFLDLELKALQDEGIILQTVERYTIAMVAGTTSYTLPVDTVAVEDAPYVTVAGIDYPLALFGRSEYMGLADKAQAGVPGQLYVERAASIVLYPWPVPDATVTSLTIARIRLIDDMTQPTTVSELPARRWKMLEILVALDLGENFGISEAKMARMERKLKELKVAARGDEQERGHLQFTLE